LNPVKVKIVKSLIKISRYKLRSGVAAYAATPSVYQITGMYVLLNSTVKSALNGTST